MDIAFYKTHSTIEILPMLSINKVYCNGKTAYCIMAGWLQWTLDIQWTKNK